MKHCHNWKAGFALLKNAKTGSQRAFAYGYLAHLAPTPWLTITSSLKGCFARSPQGLLGTSTGRCGSTPWPINVSGVCRKGSRQRAASDNDALLNATIEDAPLSFRTNKTIFSSIMSIHRMKHWHRMLDLLSAASRWSLHKQERELYFNNSLDAIMELLESPLKARCLRKTPLADRALPLPPPRENV